MIPAHMPPARPMRVWQVDPNANTPPYDHALCEALAVAGCDVELLTSRFLYERVTPPRGVRLRERFFTLVTAEMIVNTGLARRPAARRALKAAEYPLDWLLLLADLARRPRSARPDVVHVQWSVQPALDLLFWRGLRRLGVPLVYTAHNLVPHDARPGDAARYGRLYRAADAIVVHGENAAHTLSAAWGIPRAGVIVAPHGPLLEAIPHVPREQARRQLGLLTDAELVLFAGLIEPYKGLADLITAFGLLATRRPAARLVIAGKPNDPFEPYRRALAAHAIADRAILDLRFLAEPELAAYLCAADLVALPYRQTSGSGLLFAARRFGCPVVATGIGGLADAITDGETGLLVPPSDPTRLAAAVERMLDDRQLARRLGEAGRARTLGPDGWSEAARRTIALYRRLLP